MLRLLALLGIAGCASGVCDSCPSVTLDVNGMAAITAPTGTPLTYTWSSMNADSASSTVTVAPTSPDACGIASGMPWVVDTVAGTTDPVALADCQSGYVYTLEIVVTQASTAETASTSIVVMVP
jgi:hypothetical protein